MKKKLLFAFVLALTVVLLAVSLTACKKNNDGGDSDSKFVPLYTGMSVVTAARSANASYALPNNAPGDSEPHGPEPRPHPEYGNGDIFYPHGPEHEPDRNWGRIPKPEEVEEDNDFSENNVEEEVLPSISVNTTTEIEYYADKNTDIFINVHLSNPSGFVILRFTLNGTIYQNYQFESGSTSELLILKVNTGDACGIKDYTIDAIKYIDDADNLNKDVDMTQADKTVKVGVTYDSAPAASVGAIITTTEQASFSAEINDTYSLIREGNVNAYLYDGTEIIEAVALARGNNNVEFKNVVENKTYQYAIAAVYDILDGAGEQKVVLDKGEFKTLPYYYIQSVTPDKESITFSIGSNPGTRNVRFNVIALQNSMGKAVDMAEEATGAQFNDTLSDTDYTIAVYYYYEQNGRTVNCVAKVQTHTLAKAVPSVELSISNITKVGFDFAVDIVDYDNVGDITSIKLNDEDIEDLSTRSFTDLLSDNDYTVKVVYTYDLNDGTGEHILTDSKAVTTLSKSGMQIEIGVSQNQTSISYSLTITDTDNVGSLASVNLYLDEEKKTSLTALTGTFENLLSDNEYTIKVVCLYDLNDGVGVQTLEKTKAVKTDAKAVPSVELSISNITKVGFDFAVDIVDYDNVGDITSIKLNDEDIEDLSTRSFTDLLSDNDYTVETIYTYNLNDGTGNHAITKTAFARTEAKEVPTVELSTSNVTKTSFDFAVTITDEDQVGEITSVKLNDKKIEDLTVRSFTELLSNYDYTVEVVYSYDLNDGTGNHTIIETTPEHTVAKVVPTIGLSTSNVSKTSFDFAVAITDEDQVGEITSVKLNDKKIEDLTVRSFTELLSNYDYTVGVIYTYNLNDDIGNREMIETITEHTVAKVVPTVEIIVGNITQNSIEITIQKQDPDNLLQQLDLEFNDEKKDIGISILTGLDVNREYNIRVIYTYDLNDNTGIHRDISNNYCRTLNDPINMEFWDGIVSGYGCNDEVETVVFHEGVKIIDINAFYECKYLTNVVIDSGVESINSAAFAHCHNLEDVKISEGLKYIGDNAFRDCDGLKNINFPNTLISIGYAAFEWCNSLTSVKIFDSVTSINDYTFARCGNLKNVIMSDNITTLGAGVFVCCKSLVNIDLPNKLTRLGSEAFAFCDSLTSITIPDSVTEIGNGVFSYCGHLTNVILPSNLTKIGDNVFYGCPITNITIPNGLTRIDKTFQTCFMVNVVIPVSLTRIGKEAFLDCRMLANVYYCGTTSEWDNITIGDSNECLTGATRYYYSEINPYETNPNDTTKYWHYVDGVVIVWEKAVRT